MQRVDKSFKWGPPLLVEDGPPSRPIQSPYFLFYFVVQFNYFSKIISYIRIKKFVFDLKIFLVIADMNTAVWALIRQSMDKFQRE